MTTTKTRADTIHDVALAMIVSGLVLQFVPSDITGSWQWAGDLLWSLGSLMCLVGVVSEMRAAIRARRWPEVVSGVIYWIVGFGGVLVMVALGWSWVFWLPWILISLLAAGFVGGVVREMQQEMER